ncbi:hypothetical protein C1645_742008 [Glomus cerebriforme]|uniref:Uncharacterized protein n=1 Tax=Glomus cerebriforme TaxID=658196 RepID=A0A397SPS6_9GLOM|nr:hypothetical protein C1645_742008 [Glomus cerebriforme]
MPRKTEITDKPGVSYFLTTPCDVWDPLEYYEEWYASKEPFNKAKIALAITRQLKWLENEGTEKEKKGAERMLKQYKESRGNTFRPCMEYVSALSQLGFKLPTGIRFEWRWNTFPLKSYHEPAEEAVKPDGSISNFLIKVDMEKKADMKEAEVSSRIREIQADKDLLMVRKRRKQNHQSDGYTTPSPLSPTLRNSPVELPKLTDNPFLEEEEDEEDDIIAINDIPCELSFEYEESDNDFFLGKTNVSQLFRKYQNESIRIAKNGGLLVESHVQEILSLSSILMLTPNSHSTTMIDLFGSPLLDQIHRKLMPIQQIVLEPKCELTFRKAIKMATNKSCDDATNWLCMQLANEKTLRDSSGFVILDCLRTLPMLKIRSEHSETTHITNYLDRIMRGFFNNPNQHVVQWPNTALEESKARKIEGRSKQPDFILSIIHQLQTKSVIFIGEVSPPSQKDNVYKNCNDLIRLGVFMKDSLDSAMDKGADIKIIGFQCIDFKLDYYIMDLTHGIYTMVHFGQVTFPASVKEMSAFVDEMETLLGIQEILYKSFNDLYAKLCIPSPPSNKATLKKDTLCTPKHVINEIIANSYAHQKNKQIYHLLRIIYYDALKKRMEDV